MAKKALVTAVVVLSGCAQLQGLGGGTAPIGPTPPKPPQVSISSIRLAAAPPPDLLARALCPQIANPLLCRALGAAVDPAQLNFVFQTTLTVTNTNPMPLPAAEALFAVALFPDSDAQANIGAVCLALCPEGEHCGPPPADGCNAADDTLKTMDDYRQAAFGLLTSVALDKTRPSDIRVRTIPPGASIDVVTNLQLESLAMLRLLATVAADTIAQIKRGAVPVFEIPFEIEGTLWVNVDAVGKIGAGFGPLRDTWRLDRAL